MAATGPQTIEIKNALPPKSTPVLAASQTIYTGVLCMNDAGKIKKYVANTAGHFLLGLSQQDLTSGGSDVTYAQGAIPQFLRGTMKLKNDTGAPVAAAHVGKTCKLIDEDTVSNAAPGANDSGARVVAIDADGGIWVEIE